MFELINFLELRIQGRFNNHLLIIIQHKKYMFESTQEIIQNLNR